MLIVDIALIAILVVALVIGLQRGLLTSLGVLIGLVLGGLAAYWLVPIVNGAWPWPNTRVLAVVLLALLLLVGGAMAMGMLGGALRRGVDRTPLRIVDRLLGGALAVVACVLALSFIATSVTASGTAVISTALNSSQVLRTIGGITPRPITDALAQVRSAVMGDALPALGELLELDVEPTAPPVSVDDPEVAQAAASVGRVSGVAFACGISATGTGFVVATDRIVTNAHVVAGVDVPVVEFPGQPAREGRIVYFDSIDDLAVIAVDGLGVAPLSLSGPLTRGTAGVVQGYPFGGAFSAVNAEILSTGSVPVPDIYENSTSLREIYALAAVVKPGNSGGPLLTIDGKVGGVVFARAEEEADRGYAMTTKELEPVADGAVGWSDPVSSEDCAA